MNTITTTNRRPRFRRTEPQPFRVVERDRRIIREVYRFRLLNSEQITAIMEATRDPINRRLQKLFHAGYLDRPPVQKYRPGNQKLIYALGNKGAEMLAEETGADFPFIDWTSKNREVKNLFLDHTLMISDFIITVRLACKKNKLRFIDQEEIINQRPEIPTEQKNPIGWRIQTKEKGKKFNLAIVPDYAFGIENEKTKKREYYFLEADRSTMPIKRSNKHLSSFHKKLVGYYETYRQNKYQEFFKIKKIKILTLTPSQQRLKSIIEANKEIDERKKGLRLFLFARAKAFNLQNPAAVFKPQWLNGRNETAKLFDN